LGGGTPANKPVLNVADPKVLTTYFNDPALLTPAEQQMFQKREAQLHKQAAYFNSRSYSDTQFASAQQVLSGHGMPVVVFKNKRRGFLGEKVISVMPLTKPVITKVRKATEASIFPSLPPETKQRMKEASAVAEQASARGDTITERQATRVYYEAFNSAVDANKYRQIMAQMLYTQYGLDNPYLRELDPTVFDAELQNQAGRYPGLLDPPSTPPDYNYIQRFSNTQGQQLGGE
jgi:hypothetical protein